MKRSMMAAAVLALLSVSTVPVLAQTDLPPGGTFSDDDGSVHEGYIEAIAAAGITRGCNPPDNTLFCPGEAVTRAQMAAFLRRTARHVRLDAFRKHPRGPKKKPPNTMNKKHRTHVSTARILDQRRLKDNKK